MPEPKIPQTVLRQLNGEQKKEVKSLYSLMGEEKHIALNLLLVSAMIGFGVSIGLFYELKLFVLSDLFRWFKGAGHPVAGSAILGLVVGLMAYALSWTLQLAHIQEIRNRIHQRLEAWDARVAMYQILKQDRRVFYTSLAAVLLKGMQEPKIRVL